MVNLLGELKRFLTLFRNEMIISMMKIIYKKLAFKHSSFETK